MRNEWENKKCGRYDARYSRYIASWTEVNGHAYFGFDDEFKEWLRSEGLTEDEVYECALQANCGKLELQNSAAMFLNKAVKKMHEEIENEG